MRQHTFARTPVRHAATLLLAMAIAACTDKPSPVAPTQFPPVVTGVVAGTPATATIGPAGGTLALGDGTASVDVPAGALTQPLALTLTPITNIAPNGIGKGVRIGPANVTFAVPVTVTLSYDAAAADSSPAEGFGIARQDSAGGWWGDLGSTETVSPRVAAPAGPALRNAGSIRAGGAVSARTRRAGDYVRGRVWMFSPRQATVPLNGTVSLEVLACHKETEVAEPRPGEDALAFLVNVCVPSIRTPTWSVNDVVGGTNVIGRVVAGAPTTATYTAPPAVPVPNPVIVKVALVWPARAVTKTFTSRITIVDDQWQGTMNWKSAGDTSVTFLNGSLDVSLLAEGSARYSSERQIFGAVTPLGGVLPADSITTTYRYSRIETSRTTSPTCIIDVKTTEIVVGGLNGPPPPLLASLWNVAVSVTSPTTYVITRGLSLIPVTQTVTTTTTRTCAGQEPVVSTTVVQTSDARPAASLGGPALQTESVSVGQRRIEGRVDESRTVSDIADYVVTSFVSWDITRP